MPVPRYLAGVWFNLLEAARRWQHDDAGMLAAAVAYYATISLFPLLLVLIAGLGVFLRFTNLGQDAEQSVLSTVAQATSLEVAYQVAAAFQQVQRQAMWNGPLGICGLVFAAVAVFYHLDRALDKIWKTPRPPFHGYLSLARQVVTQRLKAFVALLSMGGLVLLVFATGMVFAGARRFSTQRFPIFDEAWLAAEASLDVLLNTLVFTAIFRWMSKLPVDWLHAARGGLLSALTWEVGRFVLAAFVIGDHYSAYGVLGSLLAAMLWVYYASSVLLLGAEYVQVIREQSARRSIEAAALDQEPEITRQDRWSQWIAARRAA